MTHDRRLVRSISEMVSLALDALEGQPVEVTSGQRISNCTLPLEDVSKSVD